jgi:hypothetical protein
VPYIKSNDGRREALQKGDTALNSGELNYQIFYYIKHGRVGIDYFPNKIYRFIFNFLGENPNYQKYNDISGVMIRCYKEIKRRLNIDVKEEFIEIMESYDADIDKYEDLKILENGDVE